MLLSSSLTTLDAVITWPLLVPQSPEPGLLVASNHAERSAHFNLFLLPSLGRVLAFNFFLADSLTFWPGNRARYTIQLKELQVIVGHHPRIQPCDKCPPAQKASQPPRSNYGASMQPLSKCLRKSGTEDCFAMSLVICVAGACQAVQFMVGDNRKCKYKFENEKIDARVQAQSFKPRRTIHLV